MRIEFVNHASVIVHVGDCRILLDPWIEGRIFDEGWELLAPSAFTVDDFARVTHIWFSHEHPDHFYPPNLKRIPPEVRRNIEVLYQESTDKRVVSFCQELGFARVTEIPLGSWFEAAPGVSMFSRTLGTAWDKDSWLCIRSEDGTLLNINDCGVSAHEARSIQQDLGNLPIDLLLTQFSYAAWQGNRDAVERRREEASKKLSDVLQQVEVLKPKYVMPFASFVWFCAEENFYLNDAMNEVGQVYDTLTAQAISCPVVMYPGDQWSLGTPFDSQPAIARYRKDREEVMVKLSRPQSPMRTVAEEQLVAASFQFCDDVLACHSASIGGALLVRIYLSIVAAKQAVRARNFSPSMWGHMALLSLAPARIRITDYEAVYTFDLKHGLKPAKSGKGSSDYDIELTSGALHSCFASPWGGEALQVNGRFQENPNWAKYPPWTFANRFLIYSRLLRRVSLGFELSWMHFVKSAVRGTYRRFCRTVVGGA